MKNFSVLIFVTLSVCGTAGLQGCSPKAEQQGNNSEINQLDANKYQAGRSFDSTLDEMLALGKIFHSFKTAIGIQKLGCITSHDVKVLESNLRGCFKDHKSIDMIKEGQWPADRIADISEVADSRFCARYVGAYNALEKVMHQCLANKIKNEIKDAGDNALLDFSNGLQNFLPDLSRKIASQIRDSQEKERQRQKKEQELNAEAAKGAAEIRPR